MSFGGFIRHGSHDHGDQSMPEMDHSTMDHSAMNHTAMDHSGMNHAGMNHSGSSHGGMDHGGMDHGGMGHMNMYLTTDFQDYPVLFKRLKATTQAEAFGIFMLIMVAAYVYKALLFLSWCLEVKWFKTVKIGESPKKDADKSSSDQENGSMDYTKDMELQHSKYLPSFPHVIFEVCSPTWKELGHDLVRALILCCSTLIVYLLMLVAMTYVLAYIFAVVVGLALSEVFFNRFKILLLRRWELKRELEKRRNCPGGMKCACGYHNKAVMDSNTTGSSVNKDGCCCEPTDVADIQQRRDVEATEIARHREQSGNMDANLMPAEKFI